MPSSKENCNGDFCPEFKNLTEISAIVDGVDPEERKVSTIYACMNMAGCIAKPEVLEVQNA